MFSLLISVLASIDFDAYRKWLLWNEEADDFYFMSYYNATKNITNSSEDLLNF